MRFIDVENEKKEEYFQVIYNKTVLIAFDDYFDSINPIYKIGKSYWLPNEIKQSLKYLEIYLVDDIDNQEDEKFVRFDFGTKHKKIWGIPKPTLTVGQYIIYNNRLIISIDNWLKKNSDIPINLKLDEIAN